MNKAGKIELKKKDYFFVFLLLAIFLIICVSSIRDKSAAGDEVKYITSANVYLHTGKYTFDSMHPPLIKQIFALPSLILKPHINFESKHLKDGKETWFGYEFLFGSGNDADSIIFFTRLINIFIGVALGILIFIFTLELFEKVSAFTALFVYCFSPTIIAHTRLVGLDVGGSFFILLNIFIFWKLFQSPSIRNYFLLLFVFSLAILSRYISLLFIPLLLIIYFGLKMKNQTEKIDAWAKLKIKKFNKNSVISIILIFLLSLAFISFIMWVDYGFETPNLKITRYIPLEFEGNSFLSFTHLIIRNVPFIQSYKEGLAFHLKDSAIGHLPYFFGRNTQKGLIWYFPIAFLIKTPIPLLIMFFISLYILNKKSKEFVFLITPIIILFLYFSFINKIFIGVRHILPIYPFIFIMIGGSVNYIKKNLFLKFLTISLVIWLVIGNFLIYPHYLSYFNEFIGGPDNGHKYLVDSNIDWGQDLVLFKKHINKKNLSEFFINYWGSDSLGYRKLLNDSIFCETESKYRNPPDNILTLEELKKTRPNLFISVNSIYLYPQTCWEFLRNKTPSSKVGYSIFYFNLSEDI